jgi:DNA-binding response OmpR family regulator
MAAAKVLVVDDERKIREVVGSYLEREGYVVTLAETGQEALDRAFLDHPDLIVLDLKLPDFDGEEVARNVRDASDTPIIMLTAKSSEDDRVAGLRLGADDYLVKPFSVRELSARVAAILRRSGVSSQGEDSFDRGRLVVNRTSREVRMGGTSISCTHTQFELLTALVDARGGVLSRDQLLARARGYEAEADVRTVDAHVKNLRRRLGEDPSHPRYIVTVAGVGYRFGVKRDE